MENTNYYCKRIEKQVIAERTHDLTGRVIVQCKYDNNSSGRCCAYSAPSDLVDFLFPEGLPPRRCLVKLAVKRETKGTSSNVKVN